MTLAEPIQVTLEFVGGLDALGLRYVVGGSVASSLHGVPRSTHDIDVVVVMFGKDVDAFVERFQLSFYVDRDMILDAIRRQASFNVIHLKTMYKLDVFIFDRSPLAEEEFARRKAVDLGEPPRAVWICSPEDIVLQKLLWYEAGSRISDRQWQDVLGVLQVQNDRLDLGYLRRWAGVLRLEDLLAKAFDEASRSTTELDQ